MTGSVSEDTVLVRSMEPSTRWAPTNEGEELSGDLIVETMLGRYLLNADAARIWSLCNGQRRVSEMISSLSEITGESVTELHYPVIDFATRMVSLGLMDIS